jgi:hypothetical protein
MSDVDHAAVYRGVRLRIVALLADLPDDALDRVAPATPEWRVRDVVAHLAGSTADIVSGNLADVASDAWTAEQVDARRNVPIGGVLEEWGRCSAIVEPMVHEFDSLMRAMLLTDAVTHEHDVCGALGVTGERESDAIAYAFRGVSGAIGAQRGDAGALRILHEAGESVVGVGEPTGAVRTSRFEIVRAGVGRRSYEQIAAWDWEGDPGVEAAILPRFAPPRATPLNE